MSLVLIGTQTNYKMEGGRWRSVVFPGFRPALIQEVLSGSRNSSKQFETVPTLFEKVIVNSCFKKVAAFTGG